MNTIIKIAQALYNLVEHNALWIIPVGLIGLFLYIDVERTFSKERKSVEEDFQEKENKNQDLV